MYLLSFDVIESKKKKITLSEVLYKNNYFEEIKEKYFIKNRDIIISEGDQLRIMLTTYSMMFEIIFNILTNLINNGLKARVFISSGILKKLDYTSLSEADGEIFYKNKRLENSTKDEEKLYRSKECLIRYANNNSETIDVLFLCLSKICLEKPKNIETIYKYMFEKKKQQEIAVQQNISQMAVSKRLKTSEVYLVKKIMLEIEELLKLEEEK